MEAQSLPSPSVPASQSQPPLQIPAQSPAQSTCNQCGKRFQRKAHLLRHQQQHSGDRPYSCKFCAKTFKRSDVLRDHFGRCERRGSSEIPNSLERGRKRHACDECSRLKVKCDNNIPCKKCKEFGRTCVKSRTTAASSPDTTISARSATTPDISGSDRNSIGFLLNCPGDADFMREFPKDNTLSPNGKPAEFKPEFTNLLPIQNGYEPIGGEIAGSSMPAYNDYSHMPLDPNLDQFLRSLEFATFEQQNHHFPLQGETMVWPAQDAVFLDRAVLEQRAFDIKEKLRYTAMTMNPPHAPAPEVLAAIEFITANKIALWIKLFFRHWHKHAPMVHEPTFNPCTAALPLVLSLMSLGGMYSTEKEDVDKLHLVLDTIEAYIYSIPRISEEYDLPDRQYIKHGEFASLDWQKFQLEEVQGAYLMIVLQYWTGNTIARTRVRQQRYGRVISIMRTLDMQTTHHPLNFTIKDQTSFQTWIIKESSIRTTCLAMMLDCAFGIFNNVSPRWQWAELDLTFPSADAYFQLASYEELIATQMHPVGKVKIKEAYVALFGEAEGCRDAFGRGRLTALDMQLLIHFLYAHTWHTLFCNPLTHLPTGPAAPSTNPAILTPYKTAMSNWKSHWDVIRSASSASEWEKLGFQRNSEQYYEAVLAIVGVWERRGGRFPVLGSDCEKGAHLKRLLSF